MNVFPSQPKLIEHNVKHYLYNTLQSCHNNRIKMYVFLLNAFVFVAFVFMTTLVLYFCHNKKKTPEETEKKMLKDQEYILSKIRFYQNNNLENAQNKITHLPVFNSF